MGYPTCILELGAAGTRDLYVSVCLVLPTPAHSAVEGVLAYAAADGSVGCLKVVQTLTPDETTFSFTPKYNIAVILEHEVVLVYSPPAPTGITALKWIHIAGRTVSSFCLHRPSLL